MPSENIMVGNFTKTFGQQAKESWNKEHIDCNHDFKDLFNLRENKMTGKKCGVTFDEWVKSSSVTIQARIEFLLSEVDDGSPMFLTIMQSIKDAFEGGVDSGKNEAFEIASDIAFFKYWESVVKGQYIVVNAIRNEVK